VDPALQRRVQRYGWNKAAAFYEQYWQRQLEPAQRRLLELAALRTGQRVLDVACGTGLVAFRAAAAVGPTGDILGTDVSETMIELATRGAADRALPWARFARMDGESLTLPDASFDVALCALGLMYMPDPRKALTEMHRVLRPDSRAVAAVWGRRDRCGWSEIFPIVDGRVASEVCPMFFQLGTGDALAYEFEAARFRDVSSERIDAPLRYETADEACGAAFAGGPVALAYARFSAETKGEVHKEYLASIAPYRSGDAFVVPGEFVVTSGSVS
jgi:ubiquinone/menaquinone biosynthesis C-methylase UbiE